MEDIKKNLMEILELKNKITRRKSLADGFSSRMEETEERITELKDVIIQISQCEPHRENRLERKELGLRDMWDYNR